MTDSLPIKNYRTSFYQTANTAVYAYLGTRGLTESDAVVDIQSDKLHVIINTPNCQPFEETVELFSSVVPSESSYHFTPSKLEITLKKADDVSWSAINKTNEGHFIVTSAPVEAAKPVNPYSSKKDWTKFEVPEEKEEKTDVKKMTGNESLEYFFQKMYNDADEDTKKAMIKSLQTSGGKVLSTNWKEMKDKNYEKDPIQ
ncbi:hypothetical protein WA158_005518 [Blastocystis sp. Blastoise]